MGWFDEMSWDRETTNEDDGMHFYGTDDEDGYTTWYDKDGNADCRLPTPKDDD